jgi:hypothetical protein
MKYFVGLVLASRFTAGVLPGKVSADVALKNASS